VPLGVQVTVMLPRSTTLALSVTVPTTNWSVPDAEGVQLPVMFRLLMFWPAGIEPPDPVTWNDEL
jgi:hypothetical protein